MSDQIDYQKINQRVARKIKQRKDFQGTILAFFIVSGVTWAVYLMADRSDPFVWPVIPMLVMILIVIWQALETYILADARERERDRLYDRELERERARVYGDAVLVKPKRDRQARLSDDGELIYDDEPPRRASNRSS